MRYVKGLLTFSGKAMLTPPPFFLGRPVGGYDEFASCLHFHGSHTSMAYQRRHWNTHPLTVSQNAAVNEGEDRRVDDFGRTLGGRSEGKFIFPFFLLDD